MISLIIINVLKYLNILMVRDTVLSAGQNYNKYLYKISNKIYNK